MINTIEDFKMQVDRNESRIKTMDKDQNKITKENRDLEKQKTRFAEQRLTALNEKTVAKNAVSALTREIEYLKKETEHEQANIMNLVRDRDNMKKSLQNVDDINAKNKEELLRKNNALQQAKEQNK